MDRFCSNCGKELSPNQDVCLGCGKILKNEINQSNNEPKKTKTYNIAIGIISIILGVFLFIAFLGYIDTTASLWIWGAPGVLGITSGILQLNVKNNKDLKAPASLLLLGAVFNFLAIQDLSIWSIYAVVFGLTNFVNSTKNN